MPEIRLSREGWANQDLRQIADAINTLAAPRKGVPAWVGTRAIVVSADATVSRDADLYFVTGAFTVTLPPAEAGRTVRIYKAFVAAGNVTVQVASGSKDTINGLASKTIGTQYSGLDLVGVPSVTAGAPSTLWDATVLTAA